MKAYPVVIIIFSLLASLQAARPNVLLIVVDDLNNWVGALEGHPQTKTPHIDGLAQRGVLFTNAHCTAPGCNASRTSFLNGIRPSTSGIYYNGPDWHLSPILQKANTIPQAFRHHGYHTIGGGKIFHAHTFFDSKWLQGYADPNSWDSYFPSFTQQMPDEYRPDNWPVHTPKESWTYRGHFDWASLDIPDDKMADSRVITWAESQLHAPPPSPFFMAVGIYRPHVPWYVPAKYFKPFPLDSLQMPPVHPNDLDDVPDCTIKKRLYRQLHRWLVDNDQWKPAVQAYLASIHYADTMVGRILDALDRSPMRENTIVILTSDHGYHLGHKEDWEKFALWEQITQVPLIVVAPSVTNPGVRCHRPVSLLDLYPTLLDLCDLSVSDQLEGYSLLPLLKHPQASWSHVAITTQGPNNHAVRTQHYRYIRYANGSEELYDHRQDPHEWFNIALDLKQRDRMDRLQQWLPKHNAEPIKAPAQNVFHEEK